MGAPRHAARGDARAQAERAARRGTSALPALTADGVTEWLERARSLTDDNEPLLPELGLEREAELLARDIEIAEAYVRCTTRTANFRSFLSVLEREERTPRAMIQTCSARIRGAPR